MYNLQRNITAGMSRLQVLISVLISKSTRKDKPWWRYCLESMDSLYNILGKSNAYLQWAKMQSSLVLNDFSRCELLKADWLSLSWTAHGWILPLTSALILVRCDINPHLFIHTFIYVYENLKAPVLTFHSALWWKNIHLHIIGSVFS